MNADDFVGGHSILALERFMDETRHMIIFDVLSWKWANSCDCSSPTWDTPRRRHLRGAEKSKSANTPPSLRGISSLTGKSGVTKMIGGITMSRVTELEKALTTLFRKGTEVGYTETSFWKTSTITPCCKPFGTRLKRSMPTAQTARMR